MALSATSLATLSGAFTSATYAGDMTLNLPGLLGTFSRAFTNGTGATVGNADTVFADTRTLNITSENLDLLGGGLLTPAGTTFAPARLKEIRLRCNGATAGNWLKFGGNANHVPIFDDVTSDKLIIPNSGWIILHAPGDGWVVTAGTGDILTIESNYNGTYDIMLIAATA